MRGLPTSKARSSPTHTLICVCSMERLLYRKTLHIILQSKQGIDRAGLRYSDQRCCYIAQAFDKGTICRKCDVRVANQWLFRSGKIWRQYDRRMPSYSSDCEIELAMTKI
ncbi:hypothetical protein IG631_15854 [Alternaria alternata]|nr:hypothetical protein IG631_15854 [Alternaria alternata]